MERSELICTVLPFVVAVALLVAIPIGIVHHCESKYGICHELISKEEARAECSRCLEFYTNHNETYPYEYRVLKEIQEVGRCGCEHWYYSVVYNRSKHFADCVLYCCVSKNVIAPKYLVTGDTYLCEVAYRNDILCRFAENLVPLFSAGLLLFIILVLCALYVR